MYQLLSYPSDTLGIMRKTPFHQGKEQPIRKYAADAAADISRGSKGHVQQGPDNGVRPFPFAECRRGSEDHVQQGPDNGTSNTEPRTGRTLAPKHAQQVAGGKTTSGVRPADTAEGGRPATNFDRRTNPATPHPANTTDGFGKIRRSDSNGLTSGVRPLDAGSGGRRGPAGPGPAQV